MYRQLVDALRPKSLKEVPDEIFVTEEQSWFMEYTQNEWVEDWLRYFSWWLTHYRAAYMLDLSGVVSFRKARWSQILEEIFDSPTVQDWSVIPHILDSIPQLFQRYPPTPTIGSIPLCPWPKVWRRQVSSSLRSRKKLVSVFFFIPLFYFI